jgi:flap endonuclease-1
MGIKKLKKTLARHVPACVRALPLAAFANTRIAVDTPIYLYRFCSTGRKIRGFENQIQLFRQYNITPVYIFDGTHIEQKQGELDRRRKVRERDESKLLELQQQAKRVGARTFTTDASSQDQQHVSLADMVLLQDKIDRVSRRVHNKPCKQDYQDLKQLLTNQGIEHTTAPDDAEKMCARLVAEGQCDSVLSEDTDTLVFLANMCARGQMLTNLHYDGQRYTTECYDVRVMLEGLDMTPQQFTDACILSGCDFCSTIRGIGPVRAFNYMKTLPDIEAVLNTLRDDQYDLNKFVYQAAREALCWNQGVRSAQVDSCESSIIFSTEGRKIEDACTHGPSDI